jgi:hypothetical protein
LCVIDVMKCIDLFLEMNCIVGDKFNFGKILNFNM